MTLLNEMGVSVQLKHDPAESRSSSSGAGGVVVSVNGRVLASHKTALTNSCYSERPQIFKQMAKEIIKKLKASEAESGDGAEPAAATFAAKPVLSFSTSLGRMVTAVAVALTPRSQRKARTVEDETAGAAA